MIIQGGIVLCKCGENAARYINERGELCCGICPIKEGLDSIKLDDVPQLLGWARIRGWGGHSEAARVHLPTESNLPLFCVHCRQPKGEPHNPYCAVLRVAAPEKWRTKPSVPHCEVCWTVLDGGGSCPRCYAESIS